MSQHDFDISTGDANTGLTFRQQVNAALQALASMNSGAGDPAITYPYQFKFNTSESPVGFYIRKGDNSAWVKCGYIDATTGKLMLDAAQIANTPSGNISATDVQAAINELDSEKVAKAGDTMTGNLIINKASPVIGLKPTDSSRPYLYIYDSAEKVRADVRYDESGEYVALVKRDATANMHASIRIKEASNTEDCYVITKAGGTTEYRIFHEGNMPVYRRQISGCIGGSSSISIDPSSYKRRQSVRIRVPAYKQLILKRCSFQLSNGAFRLRLVISSEVWRSSSYWGEEVPNTTIYDNSGNSSDYIALINIDIVNTDTLNTYAAAVYDGWWFDLAIE